MNWSTVIWQLGIQAMCLAPMFIVVAVIEWKRRQLDKETRRTPVTTDLTNLPATSLNDANDKLFQKQLDRMLLSIITPLMIALMVVVRRVPSDSAFNWNWFDGVLMLASVAAALYYARQIANDLPQRRKLKQAIKAELATAQEISSSLAGNNRIIHDLQAGEFNIDHVAITPAGVFAVETKSRLKPPAGNGSPKVKYDGKSLDFGSWKETKPVDQADRQARWLANYLRESTGEAFPVTAVLALPGWYVERSAPIKPTMVQVINPKNSGRFFLPENKPPRLDSKAIQRAAFALEKLAQTKAD